MVVVSVVEPVARAKKEARQNKQRGQGKQNQFDIHTLLSIVLCLKSMGLLGLLG